MVLLLHKIIYSLNKYKATVFVQERIANTVALYLLVTRAKLY